jgi:hypothetical protein
MNMNGAMVIAVKCEPKTIFFKIETGEPAGELGSVALLVIASGVWAWAELRAAAIARRKRKIKRMVVDCMLGRCFEKTRFEG